MTDARSYNVYVRSPHALRIDGMMISLSDGSQELLERLDIKLFPALFRRRPREKIWSLSRSSFVQGPMQILRV